jgi:hypothetical protein
VTVCEGVFKGYARGTQGEAEEAVLGAAHGEPPRAASSPPPQPCAVHCALCAEAEGARKHAPPLPPTRHSMHSHAPTAPQSRAMAHAHARGHVRALAWVRACVGGRRVPLRRGCGGILSLDRAGRRALRPDTQRRVHHALLYPVRPLGVPAAP